MYAHTHMCLPRKKGIAWYFFCIYWVRKRKNQCYVDWLIGKLHNHNSYEIPGAPHNGVWGRVRGEQGNLPLLGGMPSGVKKKSNNMPPLFFLPAHSSPRALAREKSWMGTTSDSPQHLVTSPERTLSHQRNLYVGKSSIWWWWWGATQGNHPSCIWNYSPGNSLWLSKESHYTITGSGHNYQYSTPFMYSFFSRHTLLNANHVPDDIHRTSPSKTIWFLFTLYMTWKVPLMLPAALLLQEKGNGFPV